MGVSGRIPVTILTGYLGAGKTTLLNHILGTDHGRRYAVIVNEFGEIGIDGDLILKSEEDLYEMNNGCVCCTVRGDLIRTLHLLLAKRGDFDAIVVETTGLADPGPVAQTFFVDSFLEARTVLDSITTVIDARHILRQLEASDEAAEQIAFADQIVLNKTDLAGADELQAIETRVRSVNPLAPIHRAQRGRVALDAVLERGGFDLERIVSLEPDFLDPDHAHVHASDITSVALRARAPMDRDKVSRWLAVLVAAQGQDILRAKGIVDVKGEDRRLVFQSVHMLLESDLQNLWKDGEARESRLVFIGHNLDKAALQKGFLSCSAD